MLYIDIPLASRIAYPLKTDKSAIGGDGDSFLYKGTLLKVDLDSLQLTFEALTFAEYDTILAMINSYINNQPALLKFENKTYALSKDCIEETWDLDTVTINIKLQEVL